MTLAEIRAMYDVRERDGIIQSPGKFEGEPVYVPHFWDIYLEGGADRENGSTLGFNVTAEDRREFPMLARRRTVNLRQTEDGFVVEA